MTSELCVEPADRTMDFMQRTRLRITMLGTGTSHGVPMIGCDCAICTSSDPRDQRTRPSILVEYDDRAVLIDTAPELRLQCVANGVRRVDAVLFTHAHADHVTGLDDLRRFNWLQKTVLPCYATRATLDELARMFRYAFVDDPTYPSAKPRLRPVEINGGLELFDRPVVPIELFHGQMPVLGFRFGPFAYCTDCSRIPDASLARLTNLDVLVLDALRPEPHPTHFNLEQAIEMARRIGAGRTYFTHITHAMGHVETNSALPEGMALAHDGQRIELTWN